MALARAATKDLIFSLCLFSHLPSMAKKSSFPVDDSSKVFFVKDLFK